MQLLFQSPRKILSVIWNHIMQKYPKFVTLRSFFKIFKFFFYNVKKIEKFNMDFEKFMN